MTVSTYYFDASDSSITDVSSSWTNDANAFDGSTSTSASCSTSGYLRAEGTNAPATGGTIQQVLIRFYASTPSTSDTLTARAKIDNSGGEIVGRAVSAQGSTAGWSDWAFLDTPSGGWTWAKLQELNLEWIPNATGSYEAYRAEIQVTSDTSSPVISTWTRADSGGVNVTSLVVPQPSGTVEGDLLIYICASDVDNANTDVLSASGLTKIDEIGSGVSDCHVAAWWKISTGLEGGVTFGSSQSDELVGYIFRISGHDETSPIDTYGATAGNPSEGPTNNTFYWNRGSAQSPDIGLTTTVDNCLILSAFATDGSDCVDIPNLLTWNPSSNLDVIDTNAPEGTGNDVGISVAFWHEPTAGTPGAYSVLTDDTDPADGTAYIAIAIAPAAGGPTEVDADAAGSSAVTGASGATKGTQGQASGTGAATGQAAAISLAEGSAAGTSTAQGQAAQVRGSQAAARSVLDSFTNANGTTLNFHSPDADQGSGWTVEVSPSTTTIQNNQLSFSAFNTVNHARIDAGSGDVIVEADMLLGDRASGLSVRGSDFDHMIRLYLHPSLLKAYLYEVDGVSNTLITPSLAWSSGKGVGDWFHLKVATSGSRIRCWVDDELLFDVTNSFNETATQVGVFTYAGSTNPVIYDNFSALTYEGGHATVLGQSGRIVSAEGHAAGSAATDGQAVWIGASQAEAAGQAATTGDAAKIAGVVASAAGSATVSGVAETVQAATPTDAQAAGTSTVLGNTAVIWQVDADAGGQATVSGQSGRIVSTQAQAAGTSSAAADSGAIRGSQADSAGTSSVLGTSDLAQVLDTMAAAAGLSSAAAVSAYKVAVLAQAAGQATVLGISPALYDLEGFRFRNDDGSEAAATWLAAQDVAISAPKGQTVRLRVLLDVEGDPEGQQVTLQYRPIGGSDQDWRTI